MALTAEQIKNNLVNQILQNFPTTSVETGSVLRDVFVDPQSIQISALSEELDYIKYLSTFVQNADKITEEDMDEIGSTYGVSRGGGTFATGSITFQALVRPTQNIQIGADDGSGGVSVKTLMTQGGNSYEFTTTQTVFLTTDATYNQEHGCYEVTAPIRANIPGSEYNLNVGTIQVLVDGISNITGVYNYTPTSGGTDRQNNISYALSIQDAILGSSKNIESGIDSVLKSVDGVTEVKTLHPNSTIEPTNAGYSISYIRGSDETIVDGYTFTYIATIQEYDLPRKPVSKIILVNATVNGEQKTLEYGVDYSLVTDSRSVYKNTMYSPDKIAFLKTASGTPDPNTYVTISFSYNKLIETCQNELNNVLEDYLVLGNLLVAQATPRFFRFGSNIKLKYNYNNDVIKNEIITGISNYITSLPLGADLTQEDVFSFITTTFSSYINSVSYPFSIFCVDDESSLRNKIELTYGEYFEIDENSIKIIFE